MSVQVNSLIQKYNVPGPRYTSYPTVPYWEEQNFSLEQWKQTLKKSFTESNQSEGISLYIHLPFCESLCTFCGCHKRVTKKHEMEQPYIQAVLKEWDLYCELLKDKPVIKEIHLGDLYTEKEKNKISVMGCRIIMKPCKKPFTGFSPMNMSNR